jgi:hypothetical protein
LGAGYGNGPGLKVNLFFDISLRIRTTYIHPELETNLLRKPFSSEKFRDAFHGKLLKILTRMFILSGVLLV